jgi:Domain of unknown function (DUF5123)/Domain of unknown function (DUF4957)
LAIIKILAMKKLFFISLATILVLVACKKEDDLGEAPRLFRPVIKEALESNGNWIKTSWQAVAGSASYTAEISTDSFKTVAATVKTDTNVHLFENLYWEKLYQVRVKANAADTAKSSKFASLGEIKTARFPTILNIPADNEKNDNSVKVSWTASGAAVTEVKILLAADSSVVKTVTLNATDVTNAYKLVSGLSASTAYIIFLYSGTTVRGWANFTTKATLTGNIVDLREITGNVNILRDTIPDITSGSIILLKRGESYSISSSIIIDKTLTFMAGDDLINPAKPILNVAGNFGVGSGALIDSVRFINLLLQGGDNTRYVFNISTACTFGKVLFENCVLKTFRGVFRTQNLPIINNFEINNCVIDSIRDYGVVFIDANGSTSKVNSVKITNTTIYNAEKIIVSENNSESVLMENCTINNCPLGGGSNYYIDYPTAASNNVTISVTVNNCIFGFGKTNGTGLVNVRDIRVNAATIINPSNNYRTSDHISAGNDFPSITTYTKTAVQLWQNPAAGDFKIIDNTFPGRNSTGDPRWRP